MNIKQLVIPLFALLLPAVSNGQSQVEVLGAGFINRDPDIVDAQRMIGDVRLKYNEVYMFCDSAYRYPNQDFEAFSNVRILQGDTLSLTGDRLYISKDDGIAKLRNNIRMKDNEMTLQTEILDYNLDTEMASYYDGGTITNRESKNKLTSKIGHYDSRTEFFHFSNDVVLTNPDYTINSDTLKYSSRSETAWFVGPSTITSKNTNIYCENGWYNTQTDKCQFNQNTTILSGSTTMKGDSIAYDARTSEGEIFCNVFIQDTTSNYIITGDYGQHNESTGKSLVTDRALMIQTFEEDSLFLRADTLRADKDSLGQVIHAFHQVRFFKSDLQGVADSLSYSERDSLLIMYKQPTIWSKDSQITGDTISLVMSDGQLRNLLVDRNAFIVSLVADSAYNQIKGRKLVGTFVKNQLRSIDVNGNGQAIYYPLDDSFDKPVTIGVNKAECSNIKIEINENEIARIALITEPSGALHPNEKATQSDKWLPGFVWLGNLRPASSDDLFPLVEIPQDSLSTAAPD